MAKKRKNKKKVNNTQTKKKTTTKKTNTAKKKSNTTKKKSNTTKSAPKKSNQTKTSNKVTDVKKVKTVKVAPKQKVEKIELPEPPKELKKITKKKETKPKKKTSTFQKKLNKYIRKIKMYGLTSVIPLKYIITTIILIVFLIGVIIAINVNIKERALKLDVIPKAVDQLKTVAFDINNVNEVLEKSANYYDTIKDLKDYYEYDFSSIFGLEKDMVDEFTLKYNSNNKQLFFALKATSGSYDQVHNAIENFMKNNNVSKYKYLEYSGYQIYINSSNNNLVESKIRQNEIKVFNILQQLNSDDISVEFDIDKKDYDEALVKVPMISRDYTEMYAIFKPKNDKAKDNIKKSMNEYIDYLKAKWENDRENYNLVSNYAFEEYEGYLIYVISNNNQLVVDLIKG